MRTSEQLDKIVPALLKAQCEIGAVVKDKTGKVQTKTGREYEYKYSDLATVIEAVKGPLNANGILFVQTVGGDAGGVAVTTRLMHESAQWIEETAYMPVSGPAQAFGSAITYAKRYSLQSMCGLPSEDDDGDGASKHPPKGNGAAKSADVPGMSATQVCVDAFNLLPPEEQEFLRDEAMKIIAEHDGGRSAYEYCQTANYDNEEKLALWSQLPSNVRTAIEKQRRAAAILASQA